MLWGLSKQLFFNGLIIEENYKKRKMFLQKIELSIINYLHFRSRDNGMCGLSIHASTWFLFTLFSIKLIITKTLWYTTITKSLVPRWPQTYKNMKYSSKQKRVLTKTRINDYVIYIYLQLFTCDSNNDILKSATILLKAIYMWRVCGNWQIEVCIMEQDFL